MLGVALLTLYGLFMLFAAALVCIAGGLMTAPVGALFMSACLILGVLLWHTMTRTR